MAARKDSRLALHRLYARKPVVDLAMLKEALHTSSRTTVFRALAAAGYYTSYSHAGRFYTLEHIPDFNEDGIWAHGEVLFSRLRTLRATVVPMVSDAPAGQVHAELAERVHLRVYDTLHDLVVEGKIGRVELEHLYLFVNADGEVADRQVTERQRLLSTGLVEVPLPGPAMTIEILLAFIRHPEDGCDGIAARVRRHGIAHEHVVQVFAHYGLGKKNRHWKRSPP